MFVVTKMWCLFADLAYLCSQIIIVTKHFIIAHPQITKSHRKRRSKTKNGHGRQHLGRINRNGAPY